MQLLLRFSTLVLTLLFTSIAYGQTIYVSPDGRADGPGSQSDPLSLQKGLDRLSFGATEVVMLDGVYNIGQQQVGIYDRSGTADNPLILRAQNRWGAKIVGDIQYQCVVIYNSQHVIVDGIEVYAANPSNPTYPNGTGISSQLSDYVTIRNCYVHDMALNGIAFNRGDYFTIEKNTLRDNSKISTLNGSGISIYQPRKLDDAPGAHGRIRRNVCYRNEINEPFVYDEIGIDIGQPTDGNGIILDDFNNTQGNNPNPPYDVLTIVENNLCFDNGGAGIKVFETVNAMIRHNTVYHNLQVLRNYPTAFAEIDVSYTSGTALTIANNIIVADNADNTLALNYQNNFNYNGQGYLQRYSNIVVGGVRMSGDDQWDAYGDNIQPVTNQGFVKLANPTTNVGTIRNPKDFDQFFRPNEDSPAIDFAYTGTNFLNTSCTNGSDIENTSRPLGNGKDIGCYEGSTGNTGGGSSFTDDVVSVSAPGSVNQGETVQVTVQYSASTTRDVAVRLEDTQNGYAQVANEGRQTVNAGTGTITFNLTVNNNAPVANDRFQFQTLVTEVGGWWNEKKDNFGIYGVDITSGGGSNVIGEVGSSSANDQWKTVNLNRSYSDPVVIMGALPMYGGQAATTRVRNVTSNSFQWRVDEWEYLDEGHATETVSYLVIESGRHTLNSGHTVVAGNTSVGTGYKVAFYSALSATPTVFTSVNTENEAQAVNVRVRNVTSSDFEMQLQEEENGGTQNGNRGHVNETVGYLVISQGSSNGSGTEKLEAFTTADNVTQANRTVSFAQSYGSDRQLFLHSQTRDGGDAGKMRFRHNDGYTGSQMKIFFQEEQSKDAELGHTSERAGYLIFDTKGDLTASSSSSREVANTRQTASVGESPVGQVDLEENTNKKTIQLSVFPNPNNGQFTISVTTPIKLDNAVAQLVDLTGRAIYNERLPLNAGNNRVRVEATKLSLPPGVYILRIIDSVTDVFTQHRVMIK